MATYQFVIELIPETWIATEKGNVGLLFDENGFYDLSIPWGNYRLIVNLESLLSPILPEGDSWNKNLQLWGNEEYSDIQVRSEGDGIEGIKIRLDLRGNTNNLKLDIIKLAKHLKCMLFLPTERKIIKPDISALNDAISNSSAAKFVNDPEKYFDDLK